MTYTGVLMTENAFYPAFVLAVLLVARAVRRPTLGAQALALLGLGILAFTRLQGLALVGAYAGAVLLYAVTGPRAELLRYLRRFLPTAGLALAVGLAPAAISTARGDGPLGWLGARSGTFDVVHPGEIPKWFAYLVADLVLYVAVVPVVAMAVVVGLGLLHRATDGQRLFASVGAPDGRRDARERLPRQLDLRRRRRREHQRAVRVRAGAAPVRRAGPLDRVRAAAPEAVGLGDPRGRVRPAGDRADRPLRVHGRVPVARAPPVAEHPCERLGPRRLRCRLHRRLRPRVGDSPARELRARLDARSRGDGRRRRDRVPRARRARDELRDARQRGTRDLGRRRRPRRRTGRRPVGRAPRARGVARSLLPVAHGDRALQLEPRGRLPARAADVLRGLAADRPGRAAGRRVSASSRAAGARPRTTS